MTAVTDRQTTLTPHDERGAVARVSKRLRQQRVKSLKRLFELFDGNDAVEEVRRLKSEDAGS